MSSTFVSARTQRGLNEIAARRMIVGILACQYEMTLVIREKDDVSILHKRVHAHKRGHLGRTRIEQKNALRSALRGLIEEGTVCQVKLPDGRAVLELAVKPAQASKKRSRANRTGPKRRASATTRKRTA